MSKEARSCNVGVRFVDTATGQPQVLELPIQLPKSRYGTPGAFPALDSPRQGRSASNRSNTSAAAAPGSMEHFLSMAGQLFGRDPKKLDRLGEEKVESYEDGDRRIIKTTGICWGWKLSIVVYNPLYDARLKSHHSFEQVAIPFNEHHKAVGSEEEWRWLMEDQPWGPSKLRRRTCAFLDSKVQSEDDDLQLEGMHGLWELAINRAYHDDIVDACLVGIVQQLGSSDQQKATLAAAACWAVAPSTRLRRTLASLGAVPALLNLLRSSLAASPPTTSLPVTPPMGTDKQPSILVQRPLTPRGARDALQENGLGALSIMLVDAVCRKEVMAAEPGLKTLLALCTDQPGYEGEWAARRRIDSAKALCLALQRDPDLRLSLIQSGGLKQAMGLLGTKTIQAGGPGSAAVTRSIVAALAALVLDENAMEAVKDRGEATTLFDACLSLIVRAWDYLNPDTPRDINSLTQDMALTVAEAASQALWGAGYHSSLQGIIPTADQINTLSNLGRMCITEEFAPVGQVARCIAACLATFSCNATSAEAMMSPGSPVVATLLVMLTARETSLFQGAGHVRAAAATALAFLACHPMGAKGDDCLTGPHRIDLLQAGAMTALLQAALDPVGNEESCQATDLDGPTLSRLAKLMGRTSKPETMEFLMAGMWILLRHPHHRLLLASAFSAPNTTDERDGMLQSKLQDAINVHDVTDEMTQARAPTPPDTSAKGSSKRTPHASSTGDPDAQRQPGSTGNAVANGEGEKRASSPSDATTEDWGLLVLVAIGEKWLKPLSQVVTGDASTPATVKLFEFLVASICLFMVPSDAPPPKLQEEMVCHEETDAAGKVLRFWAMRAAQKEVSSQQPQTVERCLRILTGLLALQLDQSYKCLTLAAVTLWNCIARDAAVEKRIVEMGVGQLVLSIVASAFWPACLRDSAAGLLSCLAERWSNITPHLTSIEAVLEAMLILVRSTYPLLELRGAQGLARLTSKAPFFCPTPRTSLASCKRHLASQGAIPALLNVLQRCNRRYVLYDTGKLVSGNRLGPPSDKDQPTDYERNMATHEAILDTYTATLSALLNLSTMRSNQNHMAKHGLGVLLGTAYFFTGRAAAGTPESSVLSLVTGILQNLSLHPANRTRLYKAELAGARDMETGVEQEAKWVEMSFADPDGVQRQASVQASAVAALTGHPVPASERPSKVAPGMAVDPTPMGSTRTSISPEVSSRQTGRGAHRRSQGSMRRSQGSVETSTYRSSVTMDDERRSVSTWPAGSPEAMLASLFQPISSTERETQAKGKVEELQQMQDERFTSAHLHNLLQRPLSHLWAMDNPDFLAKHGKACWQPPVWQYEQLEPGAQLPREAWRLLRHKAPPRVVNSLTSSVQAFSTAGSPGEHAGIRPGTAVLDDGRMALTLLHTPGGLGAPQRPLTADAIKAVGVDVVMSPERSRTLISFRDKSFTTGDPTIRPHLTIFEHSQGARVYENLFPSYQLPNGKKAFFYYAAGRMVDEVVVPPCDPPARPTSVPQALQQTMPLAQVLENISNPSAGTKILQYRPVPRLVPLPLQHTLCVKNPNDLTLRSFGDLRLDNLQMALEAQRITESVVTTREESLEAKPVDTRIPWTLATSIFRPRLKEADSQSFLDTPLAMQRTFEVDWGHACDKEKFTSMVVRENKAVKASKGEEAALREVKDALAVHAETLRSVFMFYACGGSADTYHLSLNSFTAFLDDCKIPDADSPNIKRSDCDTIFIVANFQPDKRAPAALVNDEHALMRFEFLEAVVRLAVAKYGKGQATESVAEAVKMLMDKNITPNLQQDAQVDPNVFRNTRLYCEEVDTLLKRHANLLKALYSAYRGRPQSGGLRFKVLKMDTWLNLIGDCKMTDAAFPLNRAQLAYLWGRMGIVDEIKDYGRYESLTFTDFLEALARLAELKPLPSASDLADGGRIAMPKVSSILSSVPPALAWLGKLMLIFSASGVAWRRVDNILQWQLDNAKDTMGDSLNTRPLYAKLELLLDLMFRRLYYNSAQSTQDYSLDNVLRLLKKKDKDMGP
ncbi:hypothetical protein WJX74_001162 [Apatococcus lobatus]|uniref:Uncharacterized protein n=1 Tax=Apatococcus lobatus TaxID=904363 RepID=A0AAW1QWT4_9CHLO